MSLHFLLSTNGHIPHLIYTSLHVRHNEVTTIIVQQTYRIHYHKYQPFSPYEHLYYRSSLQIPLRPEADDFLHAFAQAQIILDSHLKKELEEYDPLHRLVYHNWDVVKKI